MRQTNYSAPDKNPEPENRKTPEGGSMAELGYRLVDRAPRGQDRKPISSRSSSNSIWPGIDNSDR